MLPPTAAIRRVPRLPARSAATGVGDTVAMKTAFSNSDYRLCSEV
jgi:hypothetical protein